MSATFPIKLGGGAVLDAQTLVDTRLLVTGNSGSGKSWLLRLIAEQAAPRMQTIILDPEGEYSTLREKVDAVLVGRDGEVAVNGVSPGGGVGRMLAVRVIFAPGPWAVRAELRAHRRAPADRRSTAGQSPPSGLADVAVARGLGPDRQPTRHPAHRVRHRPCDPIPRRAGLRAPLPKVRPNVRTTMHSTDQINETIRSFAPGAEFLSVDEDHE